MADEHVSAVEVKWVDGLRFLGRAEQSGASMVLDGAKENGGNDSAVRPMEALLVSLAGCTGMDVISILQKKRQQVTGLTMNVRGTRADEHPRRYVRIELEYVVKGHDVQEQAVARSVELSQEKYCGVTATLNAEVVYSYRVEEA